MKIAELLRLIASKVDEGKSYCVFGRKGSSDEDLSSECFLDEHPEITEENEEIYSKFVQDNNLEFWYSSRLLQDVILSVLDQDADASPGTMLKAISYYCEHDDYLDINQ